MAHMQNLSSTLLLSNINTKHSDPSKQSRIMEKLKAAVFDRLTKIQPNKPLSPAQINAVELRLNEAFPTFHTPTHPTYCSMIENAIKELNEEDGSREESISEYILANYEGLPWAHKRYLSYYLEKLCQTGEVLCTSSNSYTLPGLISWSNWKKKRLRPKSRRKRKAGSTGDDNLDGNEGNENEAFFQEEGTRMVENGQSKRRRSCLVVHDDGEEMGGTEVVGKQDNMVESSEMPETDGKKETLEWEGRDEADGKDNMHRQHHVVSVYEVLRGVIVEQGSPSAQLIESNTEPLPPKEAEGEVKAEDLALACDPSEGKTDPQLQLASTVEKTSPGEPEDEARTEALPLDHECCGANLMLVPSECFKKSALDVIDGGPAATSVSSVGDDAPDDSPEKLVSKGKDKDSCAADLMIVPFEGGPKPVGKRELVCALSCPGPGQQKQRQRVYRPRKRSKHHQEGPPVMSEKPMPASQIFTMGAKLANHEELQEGFSTRGLETELDPKLLESSMLESPLQSQQAHTSSAYGSNLMISVEKGSFEHEHGKQKFHSESSCSCGQWELGSNENGDFNRPLQQVLERHGKQRKLSMHAKESRAPTSLASSMSGAVLQTELPGSEDTAKMVLQKGKNMTRCKRNQSLGRQRQPKRLLQPHGHKSCSPEAVAAPESETFQSFVSGGGSYNGCKRHEGQAPQTADSVADATSEKSAMELQHQRRGEGQDPRSCPYVEVTADTLLFNDQHHKLGENQELKGNHDLFHKSEQKNDLNLRESSRGENKNGPEEDPKHPNQHHQQQERPSEPATNLILEEAPSMGCVFLEIIQEKEKDGGIASLHLELLSVKPSSQSHHDKVEDSLKQGECEVCIQDSEPVLGISMEGKMPISNEQSLLIKEDPKIKCRGRPRKQNEETKDAAASLNLHHQKQDVLSDTVSHEQLDPHNKQQKKAGRGRPKKQKESLDVAALLNLHDQLEEEQFKSTTCWIVEKDGQGSPRRQKEAITEDVAALVNLHDQQQEGLSELSSHQKSGRGTIGGQIEATKEAFSPNLHDQQKEGPATCKPKKKSGRGRPKKLKETTIEDVQAILDLNDKQQKGPSQPTTCQSEKKDGQESPRRQITQDVGAVSLHDWQQEGLPEPASHWPAKKDEEGAPRKQTESITDDATVLVNLYLQQSEVPSEPAKLQPIKKDGRGRPRKQKVVQCEAATMKDVAAVLNMHGEEQEGASELATSQLRKKDHEGWPEKQKVTTEDMLAAQNVQDQQQEKQCEPATYQRKMIRGRPKKQTVATVNDVSADPNLQDPQEDGLALPILHAQQHEGQSEQPTPQLEKRDGRGRPRKQREATSHVVAALSLHDQQQEDSSEPATHQMKKDGRGRPLKSKDAEKSPLDLDLHQQEWPSKPASHSPLDAASVFCQPGEKKRQQENVSCHDFKLPATPEGPISLRTRSSVQQWKQKLDEQGRADQQEAATTCSGSQADHQGQELELSGLEKPLKSTPAPVLVDGDSHQQEMEQKPDQEEKQLQSPGETPGESQAQVHKAPSEPEQVTKLLDDEIPEQQKSKSVVRPLVNQPYQQEEEQCEHHVEKQDRLRSQATLPKQKSAKEKPFMVPLSSKNQLRPRN